MYYAPTLLQSNRVMGEGCGKRAESNQAAGICKGAPGNTSGRSVFPKCPVARHFVCFYVCIWYAIANCLEGCSELSGQRVGIARQGKDLLVTAVCGPLDR